MTATRKPLGKEGLMNVLLAPHVTEKTSLGLQERNQYAFRVRRDATRTDVRRAVELSATRYCSASAMLGKAAPVTHRYRVLDETGAEVAAGAMRIPDLTVSVLIPNRKGAERAFLAGVHKVNYVLSASEGHNLSNVRRSTAESLEDFRRAGFKTSAPEVH